MIQMKSLSFFLLILLTTTFNCNADQVENKQLSTIEADIKTIMEANLKSLQDENMEALLATIHPESSSKSQMKPLMTRIFKTYDLKYEILSYKYITFDGELAYVRVKQRTTKISGPAIKDNELEQVNILKQDNGSWKILTSAQFNLKFIK